jgi:hypothetical protein
MWKNFSQLLNLHSNSDVKQIEIHIAELLVLDPSPFEAETTIAKLKKYKLPGSDQSQTELIQAGSETLLQSKNSLILFGIRKNCLSSGRSKLLY